MSNIPKPLRLITALVITLGFLFSNVYALAAYDDIEKELKDIEKELKLVEKYYQKKQYKRVQVVLNRIIKETGIDDWKRDNGMVYPEYIRSSIRYWQNVIKDRKGYFKDFSRITGIVIERFGNMAGYFKIQKGKTIRSFIYERNILVVGGEISIGRKVTVYYIPETGEFDQAVKVQVH